MPVPRSGSKPPGYVSYSDPADGNRNLGNANSSSFTFMRRELRDELMEHDFVGGSRYAAVHFDSDAKVDYILDVAGRVKQ